MIQLWEMCTEVAVENLDNNEFPSFSNVMLHAVNVKGFSNPACEA